MRSRALFILPGFAAMLFLAGCAGSTGEGSGGSDANVPGAVPCVGPDGASFDPPDACYRLDRGIVYDSPPDGGPPLSGDLYRPARGGPFPIVLHIHGGGWVLGGRGLPMGAHFGEYLACRGFAVFDIDYRMIPRVAFPDDIRDCKCAIRWLRGNAALYGLDPSRLAVTGGSAGGHLTAMVSLTGDDAFFNRPCPGYEEMPVDVQAAIPFYGVHDWRPLWVRDMLDLESLYLGGTEGVPPTEEALLRVSPISYASRASCPFQIVQGAADIGVLKEQALWLDQALRDAGKSSRTTIIEGANHAFDLFPSSSFTAAATEALLGFLEEQFGRQRPERSRASSAAAPKGSAEEHLRLARQHLEANEPRAAGVEYLSVVSAEGGLDPESCEGNYGYLLTVGSGYLNRLVLAYESLILDTSRSVFPTMLGTAKAPPLSVTPPPVPSPLGPGTGRPADMDSIVANYIEPFENQFTKPMERALEVVLRKGCTFETNGMPITFEGSVDPPGTIVLGRKLGGTEANFIGAATAFTQGLFDLIAAHDLSFDIGEVAQLFPERLLDDPIGFLRLLGIAADHSPAFLTFHAARKARYGRVAGEFATAADRLSTGIRKLFRDERASSREEAAERLLGYFDASGDGRVGPGDDLWLGLLGWDQAPEGLAFPVNVGQGGLGPIIETGLWLAVHERSVNETQAFLEKLSRNLQGSGEMVNLADLNEIFLRFLTPLPDTIAVDLARLFPADVSRAKPLRDLMPAWGSYDPPGGDEAYTGAAHPILLVEGELGHGGTAGDEKREVPDGADGSPTCYVCPAGDRFRAEEYGDRAGRFRISPEVARRLEAAGARGGIDPIPDDCTELPRAGLNLGATRLPLVQFYFQDPTFNGALYVNLDSLREPGGECDARDAAHSSTSWDPRKGIYPKEEALRASNYSLGKALASLVAGLAPLLELVP